jgi:hypothetical protein
MGVIGRVDAAGILGVTLRTIYWYLKRYLEGGQN